MKLILVSDDGVVIETWESSDRPEVFRTVAHSLSEIYAIRSNLEEEMLNAAGTEDDE